MKTHRLALLSALVPLTALVSGCGGGGSGPSSTKPTPAPTFIGPSTGPGSFPTITTPETVLVLPGGELGIFNLKNTAGSANAEGTLRVLSGVSSTTSLPAGTYRLSGAFSAPTAFSVQTQDADTQPFSLSGNVADNINPRGLYTLKRGKDTKSAQGIIDGDFTRASTPYRPSGNLTFSNVRSLGQTDTSPNSSIDFAPITLNGPSSFGFVDTSVFGSFFRQVITEPTDLAFDVTGTRINPTNPRQNVNINILTGYKRPFDAGKVIDLSNPRAITPRNDTVVVKFLQGGAQYVSTSGTITIKDFGAESLSLELRNVVMVTKSGDQPTGEVTLNGTFDASGMSNALRIR